LDILRGKHGGQLYTDTGQKVNAIGKDWLLFNPIQPLNFRRSDSVIAHIAFQVADDALLVYGLDLVEIDDSIFREYPAVFLHFDNHRFNVIRESRIVI
jgi:hypothetical protein